MKAVVLLFFLILLSSCKMTQDVGHARLQQKNGFIEQAEETLKELSDDGYVDAKFALADIYSKSDNTEKMIIAGNYYRELKDGSDRAEYKYVKWLEQMSHVDDSYRDPAYQALWKRQNSLQDVLPLLARFYSYHKGIYSDGELENILETMLQDIDANKKTLAKVFNQIDHPEDFSQYITKLCGADPDRELHSVCTQLFFKLAKITNDTARINELIGQLEMKFTHSSQNTALQLSPDDENTLYRCASILLKDRYGQHHTLAGLKLAGIGYGASPRLFLLGVEYEYRHKILMTDEILLDGLQNLEQLGDSEATRILGRMYAKGMRVVDDPIKGEYYLLKLADDDPKASLYLGRLYLSGKLGVKKLQAGVDYLLLAARNGQYLAYYDLSEAFNGWPGIKRNPTYSWVFANMAKFTADSLSKTEKNNLLIAALANEIEISPNAERLLLHEKSQLKTVVLRKTHSMSRN